MATLFDRRDQSGFRCVQVTCSFRILNSTLERRLVYKSAMSGANPINIAEMLVESLKINYKRSRRTNEEQTIMEDIKGDHFRLSLCCIMQIVFCTVKN